jgi:hypothetical protein
MPFYLHKPKLMPSKHKKERLERRAMLRDCKKREHKGTAQQFWDLIDTSAGIDECHQWLGESQYNHPPDHDSRYLEGRFALAGHTSRQAVRIAVFLCYGIELTFDIDVHPLCDNHLCCNIKHFCLAKHGGRGRARDATMITIEEYILQEKNVAA